MPLVVVRDLDVVRIAVPPPEADAPLMVDPDTVLTFPVSPELLQAVARGHPEILKGLCGVEKGQLSLRDALEIRGELSRSFSVEELLGLFVPKTPDHWCDSNAPR